MRELQKSDLDLLGSGETSSVAPPLKKLRQSHHQIAQLLADGVRPVEVSAIVGISQSRISILKADPAFSELLAYYSEQKKEVYLSVHERLKSFALDVLEELQDRLESDPEKISTTLLNDLLKSSMDRAGFGPKTTVDHTHTVFASDEMLAMVKQELANRQNGTIKSINAAAWPQGGSGPHIGPTLEGEAIIYTDLEAQGNKSQGEDL